MVNLLDRILGSTGQERTAALRDLGRRAEYYVPPELRGILGFAAEMTPSETLNRAAVAGGEMLAPGRTPMQRVGSAGRMLSETAGVAAPIAAGPRAGMTAAQSLQEGLLGFSVAADDVGRRFVERMNQPGPVPTMYSNPVGRAAGDAPKGILAYHGSPHDFDRFSMSKIGTGEGAQAYGHGLYFAEAENAAKAYRDNLTIAAHGSADQRIGGVPIEQVYSRLENRANRLPIAQASTEYDKMAVLEALSIDGDVATTLERLADDPDSYSPAAIEWFKKEIVPRFTRQGRMYEVNIKANPEDFLDWDKTGPEQSESVRRALTSIANKDPQIMQAFKEAMQRGDKGAIYESILQDRLGDVRLNQEAAAKRLREAGIPGVKYLDAGSRGAGEGSRNYVVFDENLIDIVRKYGIAGAALMLGMSQADLAQAMQSQQQQKPQGLIGGPQ